jgi:hypothetical protein
MIAALYFERWINTGNIAIEYILRCKQETALEDCSPIFLARSGQAHDEAIRVRTHTWTSDIPRAGRPLRRAHVSSKIVDSFRSPWRFHIDHNREWTIGIDARTENFSLVISNLPVAAIDSGQCWCFELHFQIHAFARSHLSW